MISPPTESDRKAEGAPSAAQGPAGAAEHVELVLPVWPELWVLARMSASAIAARLDFGVDDVDDLRLAIDELCTSCAVGADRESRLRLDYRWDDDSVHVECVVSPVPDAADAEDLQSLELSGRILGALVDRHAVAKVKEGGRRGWLTKRRGPR